MEVNQQKLAQGYKSNAGMSQCSWDACVFLVATSYNYSYNMLK